MRTHKNLYLGRYAWTMMLTGALFFTSCAEDTILEEHQIEMSGEGIYFGLTETNNSWEPDSRSAKKGDKFVMRSEESTDTLCVSTSTINGIHTSNDVQSRGARKNDLVESGFNVTAYYYSADASTPSSILFNEDVTVANDGSTGMTTTYYWPKEGGFTFLATANGDNLTIIDKNEDEDFVTTPSLSYTVPDEVSKQKDAMVAFTGTTTINNNNNGDAVPLTFTHLCAAVQFQLTSEVENTIGSIVISGVKGGTLTYTYSNGVWTPSTPTEDASYTINTTQDGTTITSDNDGTTLLLAPQTLTADATITVNFSDGRDPVSTEADALTGNVWEMGKTFIYKLTITPEYTLTINRPDAEFIRNDNPTIDAHYDIYKTTIKVENLPTEKTWKLHVSANDDANVTVQIDGMKNTAPVEPEDTVLSFAKEGFWVDRILENGTDKGSARGDNIVTGKSSGIFNVYLFAPENTAQTDREITLALYIDGTASNSEVKQTILQKFPMGTYGWEQLDDKEQGEYGFAWNGHTAFIFPYTFDYSIIRRDYYDSNWGTLTETKKMVQDIIDSYGATNYTSIVDYNQGLGKRFYIYIDYSNVELGTYATSTTNGLKNTEDLNDISGSLLSNALENALRNTYKTEQGHESERLFRDPSNSEINNNSALENTAVNISSSSMMNYILKKNKYNVHRVESGVMTSESVKLSQDGIQWFLPASEQYSNDLNTLDPLSESRHWSSTADNNNTSSKAYTKGIGIENGVTRSESNFIRVARFQN